MNKPTKEFEEKVDSNIWENNFDEVIATIKVLLHSSNPRWSWIRNGQCKYIGLRIDMRDGGFIILDKDKNRISLDQLKYQYQEGDENKNP